MKIAFGSTTLTTKIALDTCFAMGSSNLNKVLEANMQESIFTVGHVQPLDKTCK
jgi:hypothetical protein